MVSTLASRQFLMRVLEGWKVKKPSMIIVSHIEEDLVWIALLDQWPEGHQSGCFLWEALTLLIIFALAS